MLFSDALVAVYPRWRRLSSDGAQDSYARRVIVNRTISWWRRFGRRERLTEVTDAFAPALPDHASLSSDAAAALALWACLPARQPAAVTLRFYDDLAYAEIADILAHKPASKSGKDWVLTKRVGDISVKAVSMDRPRAERILSSAARVTPNSGPACPAHSRLEAELAARPRDRFKIGEIESVSSVVICQYDLGAQGSSGLRAKAELTGVRAQALRGKIKKAPANPHTSCDPEASSNLDVALELRLTTEQGARDMYVRGRRCPDGVDPPVGGFDDGTTIRTLTQEACRMLLVPPIALDGAIGARRPELPGLGPPAKHRRPDRSR